MPSPLPSPLVPAPGAELEQRGIDVIRGLAIDAPRAANSGHPGTADGAGPTGPRAVHPDHAPRPVRSGLARPRPLRPVQRPRLDPPVLHAPPDRLRAHPRGPAPVPQLGQRHAGPPRAAPHRRGRGHHRPARPGLRQRRRHGHRRAVAADPLLPRAVRPPHLRDRRRRLPRRGHLPRVGVAGRPPAASAGWSTSTTTTTSPSTAPPSWPSTTTPPSGSPPTAGRVDDIGEVANDLDALEAALVRARADEDRPSLIILRSHIGYPAPDITDTAKAHGDPLSDDEAGSTKEILGLPGRPDVLGARRRARHVPLDHPPGPGHAGRVGGAARRRGTATGPAGTPPCAGHGMPGWESTLPTFTPADGPMATRKAVKACLDATQDEIPGLMPGSADLTGNTGHGPGRGHRPVGRRPGRQPHPLRHPRARHGRGHDRHGRPRRDRPGGRHVLRLLRLHARCGPGGGDLRGPRRLLVDPRLDRPRPGRPDPSADRAAGRRPGHARPPGDPAGRRQRDGPGVADRRRRRPGPPP